MSSQEHSFVLVHGYWHGAWSWDEIVSRLELRGHRAVAVELPGRDNPAGMGAVSLDDAVEAVAEALRSAPGPSTLVAHSMGGVVASQAAEREFQLVRSLIYAAAFVPPNGQSVLDIASAPEFGQSLVAKYQRVDPDAGTCEIPFEHRRATFYGTCSEEVAAAAAARLVPDTLQLPATPVSLSEERWGRVPRHYIETLQDQAVRIEFQRLMQRGVGFDSVRTVDSDHSPFLAQPDEFTDLLVELAT